LCAVLGYAGAVLGAVEVMRRRADRAGASIPAAVAAEVV